MRTIKLGERIRELRKSRGLKQKDLAKKLKVSSVFVHAMETGYKVPTDERIKQIAYHLNLRKETEQELLELKALTVNGIPEDVAYTIKELNKHYHGLLYKVIRAANEDEWDMFVLGKADKRIEKDTLC